jgi:hypothetical protein
MAAIEHGTREAYNDEYCRCPKCKLWKYETWPEVRLEGKELPQMDMSWVDQGVCRTENHPVQTFFEKTVVAIQICARCPVAKQCKSYAEANDEQYGVWGGISFYRGKPLGTSASLRQLITRIESSNLEERKAMREMDYDQLREKAKRMGIL